MRYTIEIRPTDKWTYNWSKDINPVKPDSLTAVPLPDGLRVSCAGPAYSGALYGNLIEDFTHKPAQITLSYEMQIDDATQAFGQVVETDMKLTDADGWTYDGSFQFVIPTGWNAQTGPKWGEAEYKLDPAPLPSESRHIEITYAINYQDKQLIQVIAIDGATSRAPAIPATQIGWQKSTLLTQLQLCIGAVPAAYSVKFCGIQYGFDV